MVSGIRHHRFLGNKTSIALIDRDINGRLTGSGPFRFFPKGSDWKNAIIEAQTPAGAL
jgi:hypothetical protein